MNEKEIAEKLLQINAIKLSVDKPFTWASGWKSPIYCDNRKALSFPEVRTLIKNDFCRITKANFPQAAVIAGVATAGIPWGMLVADALEMPFIYVRPKPKEHGLNNQVEGFLPPGKPILIVEDLISTGKSSLQVVEVLRNLQADVAGIVSIFNYGFDEAKAAILSSKIECQSLTNYEVLIELELEKDIISEVEQNTLLNWRANPSKWKQDI